MLSDDKKRRRRRVSGVVRRPNVDTRLVGWSAGGDVVFAVERANERNSDRPCVAEGNTAGAV